jgi:hypothetical protein
MADVASSLDSWSTTESSNSPAGATSIGSGLDDNLRQIQATVRQLAATATVASATANPFASTDNTILSITGTSTLTALGTKTAGIYRVAVFAGALTLTHNATSHIILGGANLTTAAGDIAWYVSEGSGNWRMLAYHRAASTPHKITSTAPSALAASAAVGTSAESARADHQHQRALECLVIAVGDETTTLTTGTSKVTFRMPYGFTVSSSSPLGARASINTVSSSGLVTVDINEGGTSILGANKLTIDVGEKTSFTALTPTTIADATLADDAEITIDIDVAGTGAKGLKVMLIGRQSA